MRFFWGRGPGPKPGGNPLFRGHVEENIKKEMEWSEVGKKPESVNIKPRNGWYCFKVEKEMPVKGKKDKA